MAKKRLIELLKKGPEAWNARRKAHPNTKIDLTGSSLDRMKLPGVNLAGVCLAETHLMGTDLTGADLRGVNMTAAIGVDVEFTNALLGGADLSHADLNRANLEGADFSGAVIDQTSLFGVTGNVNFGTTTGTPIAPTELLTKIEAQRAAYLREHPQDTP